MADQEKLEHIFDIVPAYDKRPKYGIHGAEMRWVVRGSKGAVQFLLYTNWQLPHVQKELDAKTDFLYPHLSCHPMPADLGYHSLKPHYKGQEPMGPCQYLDNQVCYYDGSTLNAEPVYNLLIEKGLAALLARLEDYYHNIFDEAVE